MNTPPTNSEQETFLPLIYRDIIDAATEDLAVKNLTEKTGDQTARIFTFSPRKKTPEKIIPTYVVGANIEYNPSEEEARQNELVKQILDLYNFTSKEEQLTNQKSSLEKVESLIETRFQQTMQLAAKEDVQNGVFGWEYLWDLCTKEGFASVFGRSLMEEFYKITNHDENINKTLRLLYRAIQLNLLTNYGKALKNIGTLSPEDFEKQLEEIKSKKNEWGQKLLFNKFIPNEFKKPLSSLFKALVENYIIPVWETEGAMRYASETEIATSA